MRATLPEGRHLHKAAASSQNRLQRIPHKAKMACMVARLGLVLLCFSVACSFNTNGVQILTAHDAGGTGGGGSKVPNASPALAQSAIAPLASGAPRHARRRAPSRRVFALRLHWTLGA